MTAKKGFTYALIAYVCFVFVQSLFFKFTGSEETDIIFNTIADWMKTVGLGFIAPAFAAYGGYIIGGTEHLIHLSAECKKLLTKAGDMVEVNVVEDPNYFVAIESAFDERDANG